jgi:crossover junction endodeoxyribonuclease RuvC
MAIEEVFVHHNVSAALKLGQARGAAIVATTKEEVPIFEYSPRFVKNALVGYGAAEKHQVKEMVMKILNLNKAPQADAADALAIAICHSHGRKSMIQLQKMTKN